ncbi:MAG TPA: hypothetical protein VMW27_01380 [Thermoanaerobaculia bacterium]|nr:hypothetical protein [Thermoanaerobaculia bacterium]
MARHWRRLFGAALLSGMVFPGAVSAAPLARLVIPEDSAEILAGSLATVEWAPEAGLPPHVEEWEAFLSIDGGKTYPLRITPHLDAHIRRFAFRVPYLPTRDARLLLRFGNERREVEQETPQLFTITVDPEARPVLEPLASRTALSRGEHARADGDDGVLVWLEGSRDGDHLETVSAVELVQSLHAVEPAGPLFLAAFWPLPPGAALAPPTMASRTFSPRPRQVPGGDPPASPPPFDVRRLIHRFNE